MTYSVAIIGTGNVAQYLTHFLSQLNTVELVGVCGRNGERVNELAHEAGCNACTQISEVTPTADFYFLAVSDDAVNQVVEQMPHVKGTVLHTSGSLSLSVLNRFARHGVYYPLQTFSKNKHVHPSDVTLCIEGSDQKTAEDIKDTLAHGYRGVAFVNSEKRKILHLAAVFARNFTNHMFSISHDLLEENDLSFDLLYPLVKETVDKAFTQNPNTAQTGPAVRNDESTLEKHRVLLSQNEQVKKLYNSLSQSISNHKNCENESK